jgi:PAP2 superfamily
VALIAISYLGYALIRLAVKASRTAAFAHAAELWRAERTLHLDIEPSLNHLAAAHAALAETAGYYYGLLNFIITPLVLAWLWLRRPTAFGPLRSALVLSTTAANLVFWTWPAAPPRFAVPGMTDVLVRYHILGAGDPRGPDRLVNLYAAMPSLHVAWACWCAAAVVIATRGRWRHLAWLYPAATTFVVLASANHFVLDVAAGLAVMALGLLAAGATGAAGWRGTRSDGYGGERAEQNERAESDVVAEPGPAQTQQGDGEHRGGHEAGKRAGHQRPPPQPAERGADAGGQLPITGADAGRADEEHDQVEGREPRSGQDGPAELTGMVRGQSRGG